MKNFEPGIGIHFTRDGLIVFDFTDWPDGSSVTIPAYTLKSDGKIPQPVTKAEDELIEKIINRSNAVNCFQACLASSLLTEESVAHPLSHPINPANLKSCHHIREVLNVDDRNFTDRSILINKKTLVHAEGLFNAFITDNTLRQLCALLYKAHWEFSQFNYTGATIEAWVVLEKIINALWDKYIATKKEQGVNINRNRKDKLTGADFSASIISEILSLAGIIDNETYNTLNTVRQARNHWMHKLENITEKDAISALLLSCSMFSAVSEREFRLPLSKSMKITTLSKRFCLKS